MSSRAPFLMCSARDVWNTPDEHLDVDLEPKGGLNRRHRVGSGRSALGWGREVGKVVQDGMAKTRPSETRKEQPEWW